MHVLSRHSQSSSTTVSYTHLDVYKRQGYFCMYIAALLKFNVLKRKNQALENALTEKQQENVDVYKRQVW